MSVTAQVVSSARLLKRIGDRVRDLRKGKSLSRQVLADISGVSSRYLAQLECGEGNISISLLHKVATALDCSIEQLLSEADPEVARITQLVSQATPDRRAAALEALKAAGKNRVCLIGLRGAGKSTLGRLAGKALGVPFVELNREIEAMGGMPVPEIMALYGQDGYRRLEADALRQIARRDGAIILAVAGGIVSDSSTYDALKRAFHTIWVKATADEHMGRVRAQGDLRPMKDNPRALSQLKALLAEREALYAQAEAHLDTSGESREKSLERLLRLLDQHRFLNT